jgi:hypothetical protein
MDQAFLRSQIRYLKSWHIEKVPQKIPYQHRIKIAISFMKLLNKGVKIKTGSRASFWANAEIYARFQFRGNGIFTILTRSERWLVACYASFFS